MWARLATTESYGAQAERLLEPVHLRHLLDEPAALAAAEVLGNGIGADANHRPALGLAIGQSIAHQRFPQAVIAQRREHIGRANLDDRSALELQSFAGFGPGVEQARDANGFATGLHNCCCPTVEELWDRQRQHMLLPLGRITPKLEQVQMARQHAGSQNTYLVARTS